MYYLQFGFKLKDTPDSIDSQSALWFWGKYCTLTQILFSYPPNKQLLLLVPTKSETCPQKSVVPSQKIDYLCRQSLSVNKCTSFLFCLYLDTLADSYLMQISFWHRFCAVPKNQSIESWLKGENSWAGLSYLWHHWCSVARLGFYNRGNGNTSLSVLLSEISASAYAEQFHTFMKSSVVFRGCS